MTHQKSDSEAIIAPLNGKTILLEDVPDPTFSEKMMGDGMAIEPSDGKVVSPVVGEVILTFPTKHAIGVKTKAGVELLIHVGLDTVNMDGEGFEIHVKQGDQVNIGDPLLTFNLDLVKRKAASHITPVIVTNGDILSYKKRQKNNTVVNGEKTILELTIYENE